MRVAMPVASHVDERSPFNRATVRTGQSTGPVARAVTASRMRWTISGGTVNVSGWVARSTHMQRARKACTASDVQVHLVGCTSQPKWRRIAMMRCTAPRASRAKRAPKTTQSRYCRMSRLPRPFTGKVGPLPTKWMGGEPDAGRPQEAGAVSHHLGEKPRCVGQAEWQDLKLIEETLPFKAEISRGVCGHGAWGRDGMPRIDRQCRPRRRAQKACCSVSIRNLRRSCAACA
jgi:hypothetical protein